MAKATKKTTKSKRCGIVKDDGKKCRAWRVNGKDACMGHLDRKEKESLGFGGPQEGSGRPKKLRPADLSRQLMEENLVAVERPYWKALGYDVVITSDGPKLKERPEGGAKVVAKFLGETIVSNVEDLGAQMDAAEKLKDRSFGKPAQAVEVTGADGGPVEINQNAFLDPETRKLADALARRVGNAREK